MMKCVAVAVLLLALLGMAACGGDEPAPAVEVPDWAMVAPEQIAEAKKHGVPVAFENDMGMRFVLIPAGTFLMGTPEGAPSRSRSKREQELVLMLRKNGQFTDVTYENLRRSKPQHEVTLTQPYYMQITEVTNEAYRRHRPDHDAQELTRQNANIRITSHRTRETYPGNYGPELNEDRQPVTCVSWLDATAFAAWLTEQSRGRSYGLPTEAEWEYACRAGTRTPNAFGETLTHEEARFLRIPWRLRLDGPGEVAGYSPNTWGVFDMHGNAFEWCADWYSEYSASRAENPRGSERGTHKVIRGGSANTEGSHVGSAERWMMQPDYRTGWGWVGFRLVSPLPESKGGK